MSIDKNMDATVQFMMSSLLFDFYKIYNNLPPWIILIQALLNQAHLATTSLTKADQANFLFTLLLIRPQGAQGGLQIREKP